MMNGTGIRQRADLEELDDIGDGRRVVLRQEFEIGGGKGHAALL